MPTETDRSDPTLLTRSRRLMWRAFTILLVLLLSLSMAPPAMAQRSDEEQELLEEADARLRGYESADAILEDSSTALTYFLLAGLAVLGVGVMFKSARRTHLD